MKLLSPHIPLGVSVSEARELLGGAALLPREDGSLGLSKCGVELALYVADGAISSVWYNDSTGREDPLAREAKVASYLSRYGNIASWELRLKNGWMHHWFNVPARTAMVYGLHMDVIRFNQWQSPESAA